MVILIQTATVLAVVARVMTKVIVVASAQMTHLAVTSLVVFRQSKKTMTNHNISFHTIIPMKSDTLLNSLLTLLSTKHIQLTKEETNIATSSHLFSSHLLIPITLFRLKGLQQMRVTECCINPLDLDQPINKYLHLHILAVKMSPSMLIPNQRTLHKTLDLTLFELLLLLLLII